MKIILVLLIFPLLLSSVEFTVPAQAYDADIADIDNDGDLDIIIGSLVPGTPEPPDSVSFFINNGYGEFTKTIIPKNNFAYIKMVDIDCDGLLDICTKNAPNYQLVYYRNLGDLQFDDPTTIPVEYTYVFQLPKFNDIDSDGDMDIVINHCGEDGACNILFNDGSGNFNEENAFVNESGIVHFDVGDIDNDNLSDILISTHSNPYLYRNDNFNFIPMEIDTIHWGNPHIIDMNNDNNNDILFNLDFPSQTKILYNDGTGSFYAEHLIEMPLGNIIKDISDYNNDGYPDFAIQTDWEPPNIYICFNNGDGTINEPVAYTFGSVYSFVVRSADFDGNGSNDLLVTAYYHSGNSQGVSILFNDGSGNFVDEPQVGISEEFIVSSIQCQLSNYPNPFNPAGAGASRSPGTTISYDLPANVTNPVIEIFNIKGEKIVTLSSAQQSIEGRQYEATWDGTDSFNNQVSSGVYLYRIKSDEGVLITNKMLLLK